MFYYHSVYTDGISPNARFPRDRYAKLRAELTRREVDQIANIRTSPSVGLEDLFTVHTPNYVHTFLEGQLDERIIRRIGLRPWTPQIVERTLLLIGGTVAATHALFQETLAFAGNLAGGTHHAFASEGSGYCVFNDIAVAARVAQRDHKVKRVLVIDLDVHQGDGTADIFSDDPSVFTVSLHGEKNFPFRKKVSDIDVPLPDKTTDSTYLKALDQALKQAWTQVQPDFIIYQAGVDSLMEDHLGRLALTREGLHTRNQKVMDLAQKHHIPTLVLMGGGYAKPIEHTVDALADLFDLAAQRALHTNQDH